MSSSVIKIENLSKRYRIGVREAYKNFRETLVDSVTTPFRRLKDIGKSVPKEETIWALKDISFEVKQGEVTGIIGRNGSGKTTLLKILSRITEPTKGRVILKGRVASLLEVGTGFHPELTGRENIYLNGAILGMQRYEINRKFDEIVAFSEIEKFLDTPVKRYSSGMYVRLAFAVAAHLEPEILLVDEVLAVGDAEFQKKCLGKMKDVSKGGRTVIMVSHNMTSILRLCSNAVWLDIGSLECEGYTREVVSKYLRDNRIPLGEICFEAYNNSNGAALIRACTLDSEWRVRPDISYSELFYISVEYRVDFPIDGLRLGFKLFNEHNVTVLHTATSDCPSVDKRVGFPGQHKVYAKIPGSWLAPGRYYVELGIWSPGLGHHQYIQNALAFEIIGAEIESLGDEILRPELEWDLK